MNEGEYLFIGGPRDGHRIKLLEKLSPIKVVNPPTDTFGEITESIYFAEHFQIGGERSAVFRWEGITLEEMGRKLFDGYNPKPIPKFRVPSEEEILSRFSEEDRVAILEFRKQMDAATRHFNQLPPGDRARIIEEMKERWDMGDHGTKFPL